MTSPAIRSISRYAAVPGGRHAGACCCGFRRPAATRRFRGSPERVRPLAGSTQPRVVTTADDVRASSEAESCRLLLQLLVAYDHLGRLENGAARLKRYDPNCRGVKLDASDASLLRTTRRDLALPPMPNSGLDFSGIDRFWRIVDTLTADREPSEALWHSMFVTPGYRLSFFNVQPLRSDYETRIPSVASARSRLHHGSQGRRRRSAQPLRPRHRAAWRTRALPRFTGSDRHARQALAITARFLPPGIDRGELHRRSWRSRSSARTRTRPGPGRCAST